MSTKQALAEAILTCACGEHGTCPRCTAAVRALHAAQCVPSSENQRLRVNVAQSATIAGVHRNTIYNWMRLGLIEHARTPAGHIRIYADTLMVRTSEMD